MKAEGIRVNKYNNCWEVCWWTEATEVEGQREKAVELSHATQADIEIPAPTGLSYMPFQLAGIEYAINHPKCLIADEMGLGKTIQAIGLINHFHAQHVLVVCPASLKINWQREMEKWLVDDRSIAIQNGKWADTDICICNYDILKKHSDKINAVEWDILVADESHYLKNPKAQRTQAFFAIKANRTLCLTGTPVLNRPVELFPMLQDFAVHFARSFWKYTKQYCGGYSTPYGYDATGASNTAELGTKLRETCMVRRQKSQVLSELPAKMRQIISLPTNGAANTIKAEAKAYADYQKKTAEARKTLARLRKAKQQDIDEYRQAVAEMKAQTASFGEITKLRHETAIKKIGVAAENILEAVDSSGSVIVFAHHRDVLTGLKTKLDASGIKSTVLTGETPVNDRQQMVDDFQAGKTQVFLGSIQACGTGLTLTKSSHVIFVELEWTPSVMEQAEDRAHRIGQKDSVLVQYLIYDGSIDGMLAKKMVDKEEIIESIMD